MKKTISNYQVELDGDMIYIRNAQSGELINAKGVRPFEAVSKFNDVCKMIADKFGIPFQPVITK